MTQKNKRYLYLAAIILAAAGSYYGYKKTHPATSAVQYATEKPQRGTLVTSVSASGNIIVDKSATVDPTITGTVANLAVNLGDQVKEGQLLFNIINNDLEVSVVKAAASYESAVNSLESAKISRDSAKATYDKAVIADRHDGDSYTTKELEVLKDRVSLAKDEVDEAQKSLDASLADYKNTQADAAKRKVTAPLSGTINEINVKDGDDLSRISGSGSNAQAPIIIGDLSTLKAQVQVNEVDVVNIQTGQKVTLTFDAIPDFSATGKVEKVDSLGMVSQGVVTYNVTVDFDDLDSRIKPDMSVTAAVITEVSEGGLLVPNGAVKSQNGASYVEILDNNNSSPRQVPVQVGASNDSETQILSGISESDLVVTQTINSTASQAASSSSSRSGVRIPGVGGFGR